MIYVRSRYASLFLGVAIVAAGCGSGYGSGHKKHSGSGGSVVQTFTITEKEFSLTPSTLAAPKAGTYAFKVVNNGTTTHAFEIQGMGLEAKAGNISPGQTATLKVNLSKIGSYQMYCPIDGHKAQGMKGVVTVGGSPGGGGGTSTGQTTTSTGGGGYGGY